MSIVPPVVRALLLVLGAASWPQPIAAQPVAGAPAGARPLAPADTSPVRAAPAAVGTRASVPARHLVWRGALGTVAGWSVGVSAGTLAGMPGCTRQSRERARARARRAGEPDPFGIGGLSDALDGISDAVCPYDPATNRFLGPSVALGGALGAALLTADAARSAGCGRLGATFARTAVGALAGTALAAVVVRSARGATTADGVLAAYPAMQVAGASLAVRRCWR